MQKAKETMQSNIAPQVMVICRGKAVSVNEIADEIGVAPVYLEPVLEKMADTDILKIIHWDMRIFFQPTGYLFRYAMDKTDCLAKPEDYSRSAAGLWLMRYYRER